MSDTPPAGWYPDPQDGARQRYWDGTAWTEHTADGTPQAAGSGGVGATGATDSRSMTNSSSEPNTWTWQSITAALVCCAPIAVGGVLNAGRAEAALKAGDLQAAERHGRSARTWTLWAIGVGLVAWIAIGLVLVAAPAMVFNAASSCANAEPGTPHYDFCLGLCETDVRGTPFEGDCEGFDF